MKKIIGVLILGVCIGFTIGAFTGFQIGGNDRNIARNNEFITSQTTLPDIELYNEALKNSQFSPEPKTESSLRKELRDQIEFYKSQPPVKFDEALYNEFMELLKKEKSGK
jgi:hypothetical protein